MAIVTEINDLPDFFNDTAPIQEGDTFNGTASPEFDVDWIPVQLFADRSYVIEMENDFSRPSLSVVDEAGVDLTGSQSSVTGTTQNVVTVPTDDVYYIVAGGGRGVIDGDYTITVRSEIGDTQNTSTSLDFDLTQSPIATFNSQFDHAKDTDYVAVQLETGYTYQIFTLTNDGNTRFGIVDEEDNAIDRDYGNEALGFTVDEAGTYYITATNDINRPRPSEAEDQYRLTFDVEPPANSNTAYVLTSGDTFAEKYDGFGDLDWYSVRMIEGYSYLVVKEAGNAQDIDFVEADGDRVGETSLNTSRGTFQAVTPQISGDYFIQVIPNGAYRISLLQEVAGDVSTASRVALSKTEQSAFDFFRDEDVFKLDVIEGATYTAVATLEEASTLSFQMTAIDMDGIETRSTRDSDRTELTFTAPATGAMYVKLSASGTPGPSNTYDLFVTRDSFGDNLISGTSGNDRLIDTAGNDAFDGGAGRDTAVYASASDNYTVSLRPNGDVTVLDRNGNGDFDVLVNMEQIEFSDRTLDLTTYASASQLSSDEMVELAKVYAAYFNRAPDAEGLFFWADKLAEGMSIERIAEFFFDQNETRALYPDPSDTDTFVTSIYGNVLGRTPDGPGFEFWKGQLAAGNVSQGSFVLEVIRGAQGDDITYLQNKAEIGVYFSAIGGVSDVQDAVSVFDAFGGSDQADVAAALAAADEDISDGMGANGGEFLFRVIDVVDDPFAVA